MFDDFFNEFFRDPADEQDSIDCIRGFNNAGVLLIVVGIIALVLPGLLV